MPAPTKNLLNNWKVQKSYGREHLEPLDSPWFSFFPELRKLPVYVGFKVWNHLKPRASVLKKASFDATHWPSALRQAFSIFSQMPQDLPDVVSYSTLISSCGRAGNWQQALRIFADMSKVRVQANIFSFNAIISSCEKDGKWQQGLSFFDQMSKLEISPDIISYNAVISACEKGGQWQQALQIFEAMPKMKTQAVAW